MPEPDRPHVVICGAGLAGALLAAQLGRRGWRVDLYERRPDPRAAGFVGGRSINLALSTRGITALERIGLAERVLADSVPMRGRMMHDRDGGLTYQPYSKDPDRAIRSVSRGGLNHTLLDAAEAEPSVRIRFGWRCTDADLDAPAALLVHEETGEERRVEAQVVIGADGAYSAVRGRMQRSEGFDFAQSWLEHGYKELTMPPTAAGDFALEPNALHIWPRGGFMMIALPNADRSFTCTCFWPLAGPRGFDALRDDEAVRRRFLEEFGDAVPLIPDLERDYRENPVGRLVTVRCAPWHHGDGVLLVGDAAHAIVPFYGQGMNAAFEDCRVLDELLDAHDGDWRRVLPAYSAARVEQGEAIADLALENFVEMRDHVASTRFLLKKKAEKTLHRLFPRWFEPLYDLVSFSNVPYAEARRRAARQAAVVRGVAIALAATLLLALVVILVVAFTR